MWEKILLTADEASELFGLERGILENIIAAAPDAVYLLRCGDRVLIKRKVFERYLENSFVL